MQENLLLGGALQGTAYAKWGHVLLEGKGNYDARIVAGTMRIVTMLNTNISPSSWLPVANDVYWVE